MADEKIIVRSATTGSEGDSAEVNRLFPVHGFMNFDPFVLWDDFTIRPGAGFPDHPHRGFEGVTYVIQGSINHTDKVITLPCTKVVCSVLPQERALSTPKCRQQNSRLAVFNCG